MYTLYSTMLQERLIARVRSVSADRADKLKKIKNRRQAEKYCGDVRRKISRCFGAMPKKTPLNIRVVSEATYDGFNAQNVIFESRPGYLVTGNLYIPAGDGQVPVVLVCCGHANEGKISYQTLCVGLVKQGYMVFIVDPVSQGERWQYAEDNLKAKSWKGKRIVYEHNIIGKPQRLTGEFFGTWRVWDKIRALDVLLSHPRADKSRVGVTGNSGGGTLSSYINALDNRITMAAPGCYITSYLHNLENSLPCDAEQMIPNMLAGGMEMIDLIIARAPRPTIILAQKYDFFDSRGAEEGFKQAKKIYKLLGAEENIKLFIGPQAHGYSIENREAMYKFFKKQTGVKAHTKENKLKIKNISRENLLAADGDVNKKGSKLTWEFTRAQAEKIKSSQPSLTKKEKLITLDKILKLPKRTKICHYRNSQIGGAYQHKNKAGDVTFITQYLVETEPGIHAILNRFIVNDSKKCFRLEPPGELTLFIMDTSSFNHKFVPDKIIMEHAAKDMWTLDVRGFGVTESKSLCGHDIENLYGMDYMMAVTYDMLGESMLGWRVHDALCTLDLLVANGCKRITLIGKGNAAVVATLAGALHPKVKKLELVDPVESFYEMACRPISKTLFSTVAPGFLKYFDWIDFIKLV